MRVRSSFGRLYSTLIREASQRSSQEARLEKELSERLDKEARLEMELSELRHNNDHLQERLQKPLRAEYIVSG